MPRNVLNTFNKMHVGYRIHVEWGIGGLKLKFPRLMEQFDATKPKYTHLFKSCALLTKFLYRRRMDLLQAVIGNKVENPNAHGWEGDY